jgi:hypothetical protein
VCTRRRHRGPQGELVRGQLTNCCVAFSPRGRWLGPQRHLWEWGRRTLTGRMAVHPGSGPRETSWATGHSVGQPRARTATALRRAQARATIRATTARQPSSPQPSGLSGLSGLSEVTGPRAAAIPTARAPCGSQSRYRNKPSTRSDTITSGSPWCVGPWCPRPHCRPCPDTGGHRLTLAGPAGGQPNRRAGQPPSWPTDALVIWPDWSFPAIRSTRRRRHRRHRVGHHVSSDGGSDGG